jgi:hypothetical protein
VRKYVYLAMAAASVSVLAAPVVASAAPTAKPHVLTVGKARGTAVKVGAKLSASLAKGTVATFALNGMKLTCKTSSFTAVVTKNPTAPGTALESLTAQTVAKCTTSVAGVKIKSVKANNLPYNTTVSDKKGDPVTVAGRTKAKPLSLTSTGSLGQTTIACTYTAKSIAGAASNKGNTITVTSQKFTLVKGSNAFCPQGTAKFSAVFGPVTDTSVKGASKVFVN